MGDRTRHERRKGFRGPVRPHRQLPVRFRIGDELVWHVAETRNIGVGGAFIETAVTAPVGAPLLVELTINGSRVFELTSLVRWTNLDAASPIGMGIQFVQVDINVLLELNELFAQMGKDP